MAAITGDADDKAARERRQRIGWSGFAAGGPYCQPAMGLFPEQLDQAIAAAAVVECLTVILIELEAAIRARVDAKLNRVMTVFAGVLLDGSERENRAGADIQRQRRQIHLTGDLAATLQPLSRPEVIPVAVR